MSVQIEIPDSVFSLSVPDISRQVLEAAAVEGFKVGQLTVYQVQKILGFNSRFEVHEFLAAHNVPWVNYSVDDLNKEREAISELLGK